MKNEIYYKFSDFLKNKYGQKVYKIPVNLRCSCPNRECPDITDNTTDYEVGCIFCGEEGAGFELLSKELSIIAQVTKNIEYIGKNYNAKKFIVYFQNYSNTYMPLNTFAECIDETLDIAKEHDIVGVYISTRPDCISISYLEVLEKLKKQGIDVVIELGLQTVNYKTLKILNRGHGLAEFIDAVINIKLRGFGVCAHCILDLPFDDNEDVVEMAKILSALNVDQVKCHSLYVIEGTKLAKMYNSGEIELLKVEQFVERTILFLEYISPNVVIQRLLGRAPQERTIACNYGYSWWKLHDMIINKMTEKGNFQGIKCNYLGGSALQKFIKI